jgi:hypothetical protein
MAWDQEKVQRLRYKRTQDAKGNQREYCWHREGVRAR